MFPTLPPGPTAGPVPPKPPPPVAPPVTEPPPFRPLLHEVVEGRDADGYWKRINISATNDDGTYEAEVYDNSTKPDAYVIPPYVGHWTKVFAQYMKPTVPPPTTTLEPPPPPMFLPGDEAPGEWILYTTTLPAPGPSPAPATFLGM